MLGKIKIDKTTNGRDNLTKNKKHQVFEKTMKTSITIILVFLSTASSFGQVLPPKQAYSLDVKQIHSGHSLTDPLFGQPWPGQYVNLMSDLRGVWAGDDIGKATIPGSPMFWRWDNENTLSPSARYDIGDWELLVITEGIPIPNDGGSPPLITPANESLSLYVNNAWTNGNKGSGVPTLLWTTWTNLDNSNGPWRPTLDAYEIFWEEMMDYANANRPSSATPVYIIPGHRMMARLYDDIQANLVPGITDIDEFFSDNIHTNSLGDYAIAMIHYTCIFNKNPVGLPNDLMPNPPSDFQIPTPALALYLQTMIWEVVTSYSRTGITDPTLSISDDALTARDISIYPNPLTDYLYIEKNDITMDERYSIYNRLGQEVYKGNANQVNLSHLPSGLYFFKIGNLTHKIVKQ